MSDQIMPIQSDASGLVTYQRIESYEAEDAPEPPPPPKSSSGHSSSRDTVLFSRQVKKHVEQRKSVFSVQMPPPAVQKPQPEFANNPVTRQLEQLDTGLKQRRQSEQAQRPEDSYTEMMKRAQAAYRRRLEQMKQPSSASAQTGSQAGTQAGSGAPPKLSRELRGFAPPDTTGLLFNLVR